MFLLSLFKSDGVDKKLIGEYRVEFDNKYNQNYIITFREKDYIKTNFKGETIGKGEITRNLPENEEGIIVLKDYVIDIPRGKIDNFNHKSLESVCMQIWFTKKDTLRFGTYHEGDLHISFKSGIMIKIKK